MEQLTVAIFLAAVNRSVVEYIAQPLKKRYPDHDFWWLLYVALLTGALIGWFAEVNLFAAYLPNLFAGRVLTAVLIGGGSSLIHDIFSRPGNVQVTSDRIGTVNVERAPVEPDNRP